MKYEIEVDSERLHEILAEVLQEQIDSLEQDLADIKNFGITTGVFSFDKKEEKKLLKKHIKALRLVIEFNSIDSSY